MGPPHQIGQVGGVHAHYLVREFIHAEGHTHLLSQPQAEAQHCQQRHSLRPAGPHQPAPLQALHQCNT